VPPLPSSLARQETRCSYLRHRGREWGAREVSKTCALALMTGPPLVSKVPAARMMAYKGTILVDRVDRRVSACDWAAMWYRYVPWN